MASKTALVLGSTGLIGSHLLHLLLDDSYYHKVIALVRNPIELIHPRLEIRITDFFDEEKLQANITEGDDIFCCVGTTMKKVKGDKNLYKQIDYDIPVNVAKWGLEKGYSKYLLVSAIGADADSRNFYLSLKGQVEKTISAMSWEAVHIFQPSLLLGNRKESRAGEGSAQAMAPLFALFMLGSWQRFKPIQGKDVALAMKHAARKDITGTHTYTYKSILELAKAKP